MSKQDILQSRLSGIARKAIIYYWSPDDEDGFGKWFLGLDIQVQKKILIQIRQYSVCGLPKNNREKFRHVEDKICELKPTSQVRLLGFEEGSDFVIVCMEIKKRNRLSPALIERAKRLWGLYYDR